MIILIFLSGTWVGLLKICFPEPWVSSRPIMTGIPRDYVILITGIFIPDNMIFMLKRSPFHQICLVNPLWPIDTPGQQYIYSVLNGFALDGAHAHPHGHGVSGALRKYGQAFFGLLGTVCIIVDHGRRHRWQEIGDGDQNDGRKVNLILTSSLITWGPGNILGISYFMYDWQRRFCYNAVSPVHTL